MTSPRWSLGKILGGVQTPPLMTSMSIVPVSTGSDALDQFMLSLLSFMKGVSDRLDDVVEQFNLVASEVGARNDAVVELGEKVATLGNDLYALGQSVEQLIGSKSGCFSDCMNNCTVNAQGRQ